LKDLVIRYPCGLNTVRRCSLSIQLQMMSVTRVLLFVVLLHFAYSQTTVSTTLAGTTWNVIGNGYNGQLIVSAQSSTGVLTGTLYGATITGFFSSYENKITVIREISGGAANWQTYVGYLNSGNTFFGYFEAFSGTGATNYINRLGWSASLVTSSTFDYQAPFNSTTPTTIYSGSWTTSSNGYTGTSSFSFNSNGQITGSFLGSTIQSGFWNLQTQSVVFEILTNPSDPTTLQLYRGYLSQYTQLYNYQSLNGNFIALAGTGASQDKTDYGWQAIYQLPSVAPPPTQ